MSAPAATPHLLFLLLITVLIVSTSTATANVPADGTFKYVNEGEFGPFITEYDASYRMMPLSASPFQLAWYNTTPGEFYVGLRMGTTRAESLFRWVWDANRGKPVGENATLTFSKDGNLVLAEKNGKVVWSTGTANKGVVGIKLLPVGNIVLYDKKGGFVWQSFDYPTDTLMVGQSLRKNGPTKLVSRASPEDNSDGIYSFVVGSNGLNLYVSPTQKVVTEGAPPPPPLLYSDDRFTVTQNPSNITFTNEPGFSFNDVTEFYELQLIPDTGGSLTVAQVKYNSTLSILRLEPSGNLVAYTYYDPVDTDAWDRTFTYFSDEDGVLPGCALPRKCGELGVCQDSMCVACPTAEGLLGWNATCAPPAPCTVGSGVKYYKVVGVEQFIPKYNAGVKMNVKECAKKCGAECDCVGFFYWAESSRCWLSPVMGSLSSVSNSSHVAYIKKE